MPPEPTAVARVVDRVQRDAVATAIRRFLNEELTAFEFDELLWDLPKTTDRVVGFVMAAVWYYYDDCTDHLVALSRPEWDCFQRLLLLLESDADLEITSTRYWSWTQAGAGVSLVALFWGKMYAFGGELPWLVLTIPLGVISLLLTWLRRRIDSPEPAVELYPFASFGELRLLYRKTTTFRKMRYRQEIEPRKIRRFGNWQLPAALQFAIFRLVFSPLVLIAQTFPQKDIQRRVVVS